MKGNMKHTFKLKKCDKLLLYFEQAAKSYVVHLIDEIINLLVKWLSKRRDFALKCTSTLCPDFGEKKLRRRLECASRMNVVKLNHVEYNVVDGDMDGHVHFTYNTCSCRKFQLEQLPCKHVVAVCRFLKLNVYSMASRYYTRNTWLDAYSFTIYLVQPQELGTGHNKSTCKNNVPLPNVGHTL
ncbi:hypothetical protein L3X38_025685 [Prunus dulcis]|uniref:SWIM-type domain-containing protein n=1 Tax=Prunus dulcis TaxID=3755 RepID=A0AAD4W4W4_PRUDU|nr:hypothetical protein L3X38_025685 [Prunus dulcis]